MVCAVRRPGDVRRAVDFVDLTVESQLVGGDDRPLHVVAEREPLGFEPAAALAERLAGAVATEPDRPGCCAPHRGLSLLVAVAIGHEHGARGAANTPPTAGDPHFNHLPRV